MPPHRMMAGHVEGWQSVEVAARGVPYSTLLHQRYVGGVWRQVQDAYSEVAEDGGTARDKAARIKNAALAAKARGLLPCAVIDGEGRSERPTALLDVVITTDGRTYSLTTPEHLVDMPEMVEQ